ncbi:MAG: hypothetical protein KF855_03775 [Acidobacteria bacterium]|nr:hypothetical protein [Acidobacteriota bacterium]
MAKSDYLEAAILDHTFGRATFTPPATVYVALFTTATQDNGAGTEVSGGSYARQAVTNDSDYWNRTDNVVSNDSQIAFPQASANWGTVTHFALFDAVTSGNMLYHAAVTSPETVNINGQVVFEPGQLQFSEE